MVRRVYYKEKKRLYIFPYRKLVLSYYGILYKRDRSKSFGGGWLLSDQVRQAYRGSMVVVVGMG